MCVDFHRHAFRGSLILYINLSFLYISEWQLGWLLVCTLFQCNHNSMRLHIQSSLFKGHFGVHVLLLTCYLHIPVFTYASFHWFSNNVLYRSLLFHNYTSKTNCSHSAHWIGQFCLHHNIYTTMRRFILVRTTLTDKTVNRVWLTPVSRTSSTCNDFTATVFNFKG